MHRAEDGMQGFVVAAPVGQHVQIGLKRIKQFGAFLEIGLAKLCEWVALGLGGHGHTRWTSSMSFSGLNGFNSHPVAPAALPSAFLVLSLSVVRIRIGTARCCDPARTFLINEMPSIFGMLRSVMI